jgi:uncharacterized protein
MIVVSNTSPLSNLAVIGQLALLQKIYSQITIPLAVYAELSRVEAIQAEILPLIETGWLNIQPVTKLAIATSLEATLDRGEAEAIAIALELNADRLLIDERLGRTVATQSGLKIRGLLGILVNAKATELIPELKPILDDLIHQAGFRVSRDLYNRTLQDAKELDLA